MIATCTVRYLSQIKYSEPPVSSTFLLSLWGGARQKLAHSTLS